MSVDKLEEMFESLGMKVKREEKEDKVVFSLESPFSFDNPISQIDGFHFNKKGDFLGIAYTSPPSIDMPLMDKVLEELKDVRDDWCTAVDDPEDLFIPTTIDFIKITALLEKALGRENSKVKMIDADSMEKYEEDPEKALEGYGGTLEDD